MTEEPGTYTQCTYPIQDGNVAAHLEGGVSGQLLQHPQHGYMHLAVLLQLSQRGSQALHRSKVQCHIHYCSA